MRRGLLLTCQGSWEPLAGAGAERTPKRVQEGQNSLLTSRGCHVATLSEATSIVVDAP